MEYLTLNKPKLNIPLWGLIRDDRYSDHAGQAFGCLFSKSHFYDGKWVDGLLLFASPLHVEIYRQWLQARGDSGWRRFCTTDNDIVRIIGNLRDERLQLWIAAGFAASQTQQLLLDQNHLLMTTSISIDLALSRNETGDEAALQLPSHTVRILQELFAGGSGILKSPGDEKQRRWPTCDDEAWEEHAFEALNRITTRDYVDYQKDLGHECPTMALAYFDRDMRKWLFMGCTAEQWH